MNTPIILSQIFVGIALVLAGFTYIRVRRNLKMSQDIIARTRDNAAEADRILKRATEILAEEQRRAGRNTQAELDKGAAAFRAALEAEKAVVKGE